MDQDQEISDIKGMLASRLQADVMGVAGGIVMSYLGKNSMVPGDVPGFIESVHAAVLKAAFMDVPGSAPPAETLKKPSPAEIRKSITPDHLISFEDGKRYKSLRRHLTGRGLTPEQYREKWGLPVDYPIVAPNYSAQRSEMAKAFGLGRPKAPAEKPAKKLASVK